MYSRMKNITSYLKPTGTTAKSHFLSALRGITQLSMASASLLATGYSYFGIQKARNLDASETKNEIKDQFSLESSAVNGCLVVGSFAWCMYTLLTTNAWSKMTKAQQLGVAATILVALGGAGYAFSRINVEHNTGAAGLADTTSILLLLGVENIVRRTASKPAEIIPEPGRLVSEEGPQPAPVAQIEPPETTPLLEGRKEDPHYSLRM